MFIDGANGKYQSPDVLSVGIVECIKYVVEISLVYRLLMDIEGAKYFILPLFER